VAVTLDALLGNGKAHDLVAPGTVDVVTTNTVAAGGMIALIAARFDAGAGTMSVSGTGGLTWATAHNVTSGSLRIYVFYAFAPVGLASGTTLTVSNTNSADLMATAISLLGVDTVSPVSGFNGSGSTGTAWTTGSITAGNGDAIVGASFEDGNATDTSTATGPAVEFSDFNDATQSEAMTAAYKLSVAGTDSVAGAWAASVSHVDIGVAFKAAAAAAAPAVPAPRPLLVMLSKFFPFRAPILGFPPPPAPAAARHRSRRPSRPSSRQCKGSP
jgi:hypothetical protein